MFSRLCRVGKCYSSEKNIRVTPCHLFRAEHRYLQERMSGEDLKWGFFVLLNREILTSADVIKF